ncbi:MAG: hypothetical protein O2913_01025 [Chloroflexi bacterium]|nr:hypothetical protein [Chloroflexota bacterium]
MLLKIGRKPRQDDALDSEEREAASTAADQVGARSPLANVEPDTSVDFEEALVPSESSSNSSTASSDFGTNIKISLEKAREAQTLRDRSQSVFAQSESISEEAIRSAEAAARAYGEGFDARSKAYMEAAEKARTMAETLRSRMKQTRSSYQSALDKALGSKELSAQDLAAALDSLDFTVLNVERELMESAKAFSIADSAKELAIQELLAVHSIWRCLAPRRHDALGNDEPNLVLRESSAGESASEILQRELAGLAKMPDEDLKSPEDSQETPRRPITANACLERTYSGRVYLMFDASLSKKGLESVWDAVEEAAGAGAIVDTRLVSRDEGVQVTLDLDSSTLDVASFLRRLGGAELTPLGKDRLKVNWTASA